MRVRSLTRPARNLQVLEFRQLFRDKGIRLHGKRRPHAGKTASIIRIRLGAGLAGLRKTPCLSRADLQWDLTRKCLLKCTMIGPVASKTTRITSVAPSHF